MCMACAFPHQCFVRAWQMGSEGGWGVGQAFLGCPGGVEAFYKCHKYKASSRRVTLLGVRP
jgi:hypothetical protein